MKTLTLIWSAATLLTVGAGAVGGAAQRAGEHASFTAVAVLNNNLGSGAGTVLIDITRWSSEAARARLLKALTDEGPSALLRELQEERPTGTLRTPDTLAYDLRYAHETPLDEGGRRIVLVTDRPIGFWEASRQPRTIDYPFTVVQMELGPDGTGTGTLSYATKITYSRNTIEVENFGTAPVMLTEIRPRPRP